MRTYEIKVIESDETAAWQHLFLSESWGQTEPYYPPDGGPRLGQNIVTASVEEENVARLEGLLDCDDSVLSYREHE